MPAAAPGSASLPRYTVPSRSNTMPSIARSTAFALHRATAPSLEPLPAGGVLPGILVRACLAILLVDLGDLGQRAAALEFALEPDVDQRERQGRRERLAAQGDDLGVVGGAGAGGGVGIGDVDRAHPRHLVGHDRHPG